MTVFVIYLTLMICIILICIIRIKDLITIDAKLNPYQSYIKLNKEQSIITLPCPFKCYHKKLKKKTLGVARSNNKCIKKIQKL